MFLDNRVSERAIVVVLFAGGRVFFRSADNAGAIATHFSATWVFGCLSERVENGRMGEFDRGAVLADRNET